MNTRQRLNWLNSARRDIQASMRTLRIQQKMSQAELAKKMSVPVDQSTISNWESGKTIMDLEQLLDILMIFGKDWKSFFGLLADNAERRTTKKPKQKEPHMEPNAEDKGED
ncbi:helix-turn-helix transcriptional regulator [Pseudoalteromonas sp. DL2-H2.2]|uniref:helix-turn-helix transcriptional regulator n=1 Tax=Pseudoalteromonas sp. DL2-H2.2 TaxID=2908889 RepID=UPI001F28120F|nr:helix-turn-helix transcriptional regulator [Pseudoalteromonas sp. DL2-H2.2]MCF2911003.1 helix-turn-helix transcriptional regulator [Pseudoalteromonas sp. DL2-H2.2]